MGEINEIINISDKEYWQSFPIFQFHKPIFCRWHFKRIHKQFKKTRKMNPKIEKQFNLLISELNKFLAFGE